MDPRQRRAYLFDKKHAYDFFRFDSLAIGSRQVDFFIDGDAAVSRDTNLSKGLIIKSRID